MDAQYPTNPDDADPGARVDHIDPEADAAADPVQSAVRTLLRTSPDPGPMPADLSRRIEESLGQAAVRRAGDHELFDELGFGDPEAVVPVDEANDVVVFDAHAEDESRGERTLVPFVRRRWPMVGVAAAGVAVLALAGAVVVNQTRTGSGLASLPPQNGAGGSAGSVHVQVSTTAYTKDGLATGPQVFPSSGTTPFGFSFGKHDLLVVSEAAGSTVSSYSLASGSPVLGYRHSEPDGSVGDAPSSGPLVTQAGAAACVAALGATDAGAVSIDLASYEGQPAAIVVVRRSDSTVVYAVQRDCGDGDAGVIQDAVPVP